MSDNNLPSDSISRSYYAMFHAATAALLKTSIVRGSHSALIAAFSQFLVKPGLIEKRWHGLLRKAYQARGKSDYLPSVSDTVERARTTLEGAREFVATCRAFVEKG
jgi:uncharacterized protein (UPF0332 family)